MPAEIAPTTAPALADFYAGLDPAEGAWLRERTGRIQTSCRRVLADLVVVGGILIEAKDRIGYGNFIGWIRQCLPWDVRTAQRLMQVASTFPGVEPVVMGRLDPGAAYYLAQTTTPPEARAYAIELARDGERVSVAQAKEIVAAQRERVTLTPGQVRELAAVDPAGERAEADARARTNALGDVLARVLATAEGSDAALHVRVSRDDFGDECFIATLYPADGGKLTHEHGKDLLTVLRNLAGERVLKLCARCQERRSPDLFSKDALQRDGLNRYCKVCERERYADFKRRRRELKSGMNPSGS